MAQLGKWAFIVGLVIAVAAGLGFAWISPGASGLPIRPFAAAYSHSPARRRRTRIAGTSLFNIGYLFS